MKQIKRACGINANIFEKMKFFGMTSIAKYLFRSLVWNIKTSEKEVYLTFDDGPMQGTTPWILDELDKYKAKATFFCIGKNVKQNPEIFQKIIKHGHVVGNHTFDHLNGWKTTTSDYIKNVEKCSEFVSSGLFRPPYGRLKLSQMKYLRKKYHIIMWDVLSRDYDQNISGKQCLKNVLDDAESGSIILLHDNFKSEKSMKYVLPGILKHFSDIGFCFKSLN